MLDIFRSKGISNVIYGVVIVGTILAFVVTFRPQANTKTAALSESCVARVRGRCLDPKAFSAAYRILMPSRSQALSRRMNLKRVALDGLIERELLDDEAKRLGIGVTDKEVTDQLYAGYVRVSVPFSDPSITQSILMEMYQSYGRAGLVTQDVAQQHFMERDTAIPVDFRDPKTKMFDMKIYERTVRNLSNRSTTEFREEQAKELLAAKMRDAIREPVRVSEAEAWEEYDRRFSTATLTYVPVKESWAGRWAFQAKQADVDEWVKAHQAEFDKMVENRKADDAPKAGHLRHILVKLPYGATDDEKAGAVAKLSWAVARIKAGESFAEVARQVSDDEGSAAKGGDVGDKTDGFVLPFKAAADALKAGESTPGAVETQFGYHYIMRDDPAKAADVEAQARRSIGRDMMSKEKGLEASRVIAKRIEESMRAGKSADDAIKDAIAPYVVAQKLDMLKVMPAPASAQGDAGKAAAGGDAGAGAAGATSKQALPAATFDASTDPDRPQTQTSNAFNRGGDPLPGVTPDSQASVVSFAFSAKDGAVMDQPVRVPGGFDVVLLKQRKQSTREEYEKDRSSFLQELVGAKRDEALSLYVRRLREQAKDDIKIEESYVQESKADGGSATEDEDEY